MTHHSAQFTSWFVTENDRVKALTKYELNRLKTNLQKHLEDSNEFEACSEKISLLCQSIANKYLDYLQLIGHKVTINAPKEVVTRTHWAEHFKQIALLEQKITATLTFAEQKELLLEIISLYQCIQPEEPLVSRNQIPLYSQQLQQLFSKRQFNLWLEGFVDFINKNDVVHAELAVLFQGWSVEQQQEVLDYFSNPEFAALVNAIFFYKIHPDKLFVDGIHPEKLVSVQVRLGVLHHYIELMQQQLYKVALQNDLLPGSDYFLHDEELPQGIIIEGNEEFRLVLQAAVKKLKANVNLIQEKHVAIDCLHDLMRAYKFWFNPNRLIDAVMVLQQNLLSKIVAQEERSVIFQEKMVVLYSQLTTTECLDLYGYFANDDTRNLLFTFFKLAQGGTFDWLPSLNKEEHVAVVEVFEALYCVMDALRIELKNRHLLAETYLCDLAKINVDVDPRNRDAVFRVMRIYKHAHVVPSNVIEQLFQSIEELD